MAANYAGGNAHWSMPQTATLQAQQAYQQNAYAGTGANVGPSSPPIPPNTASLPVGVSNGASAAMSSADVGVAPGTAAPTKKSRMARMEDRVLVTRTADEETEDGRVRNKEAMAKIREAWVYKHIRERVAEFTEYKQALLYCGTWNVNAKGKEESLDEWICSDWGADGRYAPDVVAVGFQEIVDLNAVNVAVDNKTQQRTQYWVERLRATLNAPERVQGNPAEKGYALLMQRSMVGLLICVFVKASHRNRVKAISSDSVGVGVMGMMGNKGGVSIRVQFYDSTLCFVNSHLAAHRENVAGRNADFVNVLSKLNFEVGDEAVREVIRNGSVSQWAMGSTSVGVADHDMVFWLGDLNYRIDESMPTEKVLQMAEAKKTSELRPLDQLNIERREGRVFQGFDEGVINFTPTYKYQPGTNTYEQRPEKKLRAPAWCDRVLWLSQEPQHVQQLTYKRSETPIFSDHKPVYTTMRVTVKDVVIEKRDAIYRELLSLLERYENQSLPSIALEGMELNFGAIRYGETATLPIVLTNTGNVCAQYRLVPKLDENAISKSWITVSPTYGMLIPGEQSAKINVSITIDSAVAQQLNGRREVLNDILVLRLENGRDYYISIKADYARSCFGMNLDDLVLYKDPIRQVPLDSIERAEKYKDDPNANPGNALCIPKELWRIVDAMYEKGLQHTDLFVAPGNTEEIKQIREALDTGNQFPHASVHSYVQTFLLLLSTLSIPVVPSSLFPAVEINSENIQIMSRKFLEDLSPIHYNVFVYIVSFFREVLLFREQNQLTAAKLARICIKHCSPVPNVVMDASTMQRRAGMHLIMLHLLETSSI